MFEHFTQEWQEATTAFLDHIYSISGSHKSLRSYKNILLHFFSDPERQPDQYTRFDVQAFLAAKSTSPRNRGATVKANTINSRIKVLNSFYKFVATYEIRLSDGSIGPIFDGRPPSFGVNYLKPDIPYRSLNEEEVVALFQAIPDTVRGIRDRAIFTFAFFTTRRRAEISRLQMKHIEKSIIVDPDGTRRPGYLFHHWDKGKSRIDAVSELPQICYDAICDMLKAMGRDQSIKPDDYVFIPIMPGVGRKDRARDKPLSENYMNTMLRQYAKAAGLDVSRISFHSLRHAGAAARFREGEKIDSLARVLGHSNISTTSRYLAQIVAPSDQFAQRLERKYAPLFRRQAYQ